MSPHIRTGEGRNLAIGKGVIVLGIAAIIGAGTYAYDRVSDRHHERKQDERVSGILSAADPTAALALYEQHRARGELTPEFAALFAPAFRTQVENAVKGNDNEATASAIERARASGLFSDSDIAGFKRLAGDPWTEPVLYSAVVRANTSDLDAMADRYLTTFPEGEHRDTVTLLRIAAAYKQASKSISAGEYLELSVRIQGITSVLEQSKARPVDSTVMDAREALRTGIQDLLKEGPSIPTDPWKPGKKVEIIRPESKEGINWKEEYQRERDENIGLGKIGILSTTPPSGGAGGSSVCVEFPGQVLKWRSKWSGPCNGQSQADYERKELRPLEGQIDPAEQARVRILFDRLKLAEVAYFGK